MVLKELSQQSGIRTRALHRIDSIDKVADASTRGLKGLGDPEES